MLVMQISAASLGSTVAEFTLMRELVQQYSNWTGWKFLIRIRRLRRQHSLDRSCRRRHISRRERWRRRWRWQRLCSDCLSWCGNSISTSDCFDRRAHDRSFGKIVRQMSHRQGAPILRSLARTARTSDCSPEYSGTGGGLRCLPRGLAAALSAAAEPPPPCWQAGMTLRFVYPN